MQNGTCGLVEGSEYADSLIVGIRETKLLHTLNEIYGGRMYRGHFNAMNKLFGTNKSLVSLSKFLLDGFGLICIYSYRFIGK